MTLTVWKGYHGGDLFARVQDAWEREELLILCPPLLHDFSFLKALPAGKLHLAGTWTAAEAEMLKAIPRAQEADFPARPVLGVFTSGTLSRSPRLVLYSRACVTASLTSIYDLFARERIQHVFAYPQAFHTFGLTLGYVAAHISGWELHTPVGKYQSASHAERVNLREEGVLTLGTPTHLFDLIQHVRKRGEHLTPSYSCIIGGASVSRALWLDVRAELGIEAPSVGYGCTEASPGITHLPPGTVPEHDDEIGRPLPALRTRVSDNGVDIEGGSLCLAIVQDGHMSFPKALTIRDRIHVDASGMWSYGGRLDLTLNRGGQKFSLEAIEKSLHDRLGVGVVATSVRDTRLGEDLGLAIVCGADTSVDRFVDSAQHVLKELFGLRLSAGNIVTLPDFPLNECSKLDRRAIAKAFVTRDKEPAL